MSSQRRINASRANGARSRGPVTPEGKARSAANATRHGLLAQNIVLTVESKDLFAAMLREFVERFAPADGVELGLVEEMAVAAWRQRRCWGVETCLFDQAIETSTAKDAPHALTAGYTALAAAPTLALVHRYEARVNRIYQRAFNNLQRLRENKEVPNEPNPISEHRPAPEDDDSVPAAPDPNADAAPPAPEPEPHEIAHPPVQPAPAPAHSPHFDAWVSLFSRLDPPK